MIKKKKDSKKEDETIFDNCEDCYRESDGKLLKCLYHKHDIPGAMKILRKLKYGIDE